MAHKRVALEDQLRTLSNLGIDLNEDVSIDDLLELFDRDEYEKKPFDAVIFTLAGELQTEPYGRFFSDDIWDFDTECITGKGSYSAIIENFVRLSGEPDILDFVKDDVDISQNKATVNYTLKGKAFTSNVKIKGDWVDTKFLAGFMKNLKDCLPKHLMFWSIPNGQAAIFVCMSMGHAQKLNILTGKAIRLEV